MVSPTDAVVIVTGGSTGPGREIARALAGRGFTVVLVYLDDQSEAEAAIDDIIGADGTAVAVRADLADDMDVERLLRETAAVFGGVDIIVHADPLDNGLLDRQAVRQIRHGGAIFRVCDSEVAMIDRWLAGRGTQGIDQ